MVYTVLPLYSKATLDSVGVFVLGVHLESLGSRDATSFEKCCREMLEPDTKGQEVTDLLTYMVEKMYLADDHDDEEGSRSEEDILKQVSTCQEPTDGHVTKPCP